MTVAVLDVCFFTALEPLSALVAVLDVLFAAGAMASVLPSVSARAFLFGGIC